MDVLSLLGTRAHTQPVLMGKLASHHAHCPPVSSANHGDRTLHSGSSTAAKDGKNMHCPFAAPPYLSERLTQLSQDALLIEHLPLVAVLVVVMDALPHVRRELVEGHILLHLFVLHRGERKRKRRS